MTSTPPPLGTGVEVIFVDTFPLYNEVPIMPLTENSSRPLVVLGSVVLVVAALYWAQAFLIPIAVAFVLTFVLSPLVNALQRVRLGRIPAVLMAVLLSLGLVAGIATAI